MNRVLSLLAVVGLSAVAAVALHAADAKPADASGNLLKPTADVKSWRLEQHEEGKGTIAVDAGAIVFDVTTPGGEEWHVQAFQTPLDLKNGIEYAVSFKAKASEERAVKLQAGIDEEDWHNIGLDEEVTLGKEWKDYEYKFTAADVRPMKNRVGFVMGTSKGKVYVKDMVVKQAKK